VKHSRLGTTNIEVSAVCCGTMPMGPDNTYGYEPDDATSISAIQAALDTGIDFFETAETYGDGYAEHILGRALEGRRDEAVIATRLSRRSIEDGDLVAACEASLRRLNSDYIDLCQMPGPGNAIPWEDAAAALAQLKQQGKIRAWGVSNLGGKDLRQALAAGEPQSNLVRYSLLWRAVEGEILPLCADEHLSIICYSPLAQGILTGKFASADEIPSSRRQAPYCDEGLLDLSFGVVEELRRVSGDIGEPMADIALAWILAQQGVSSVVVGVRTPGQAVENARAGKLQLPAGVIARLREASEPLREALDRPTAAAP